VLDGTIEITVGEDLHRLGTGDCLTLVLDPAGELPQSDAQGSALCRRDHQPACAEEMRCP